jgi:hypothetical protein
MAPLFCENAQQFIDDNLVHVNKKATSRLYADRLDA